MSTEFESIVDALAGFDIDDPDQFTIAERRALDLMLDSLKAKNLRMLSIGQRGRASARKRSA